MLEFRERKMFSVWTALAQCIPSLSAQRWSVHKGKALGTNTKRQSHHWPPPVKLFGEEVTRTHPEYSQWGATCFLLPRIQIWNMCISYSQCSRASRGIGHFWRQYFRNKKLRRLCILAVCHFFLHVILLRYLELPIAYEADFISWRNMTKKCTFSFTHSVIEEILLWASNMSTPALDVGRPSHEQRYSTYLIFMRL